MLLGCQPLLELLGHPALLDFQPLLGTTITGAGDAQPEFELGHADELELGQAELPALDQPEFELGHADELELGQAELPELDQPELELGQAL